MFDINKRKSLHGATIQELIEELKQLPQDAGFCCCGDNYAYIHVEKDGSAVCIDTEDLDECYDEDELVEYYNKEDQDD